MPSLSKLEKTLDLLEFFKQTVVSSEHKIRNLEKRKVKLDGYKEEQRQGKELNLDQLAAVAKYPEVVLQLDNSRDFCKQITGLITETTKIYKKQQRKDIVERNLLEQERLKQLFEFQMVFDKLTCKSVRKDFLAGTRRAVQLTLDDLKVLKEFAALVTPQNDHPDFLKQAEYAAEHLSLLFEGRQKPVAGRSYSEIKSLLITLSTCEYFKLQTSPPVANDTVSDPVELPADILPVIEVPVVEVIPAQLIPIQESNYNFIQESQIDIESPHMDPAVVAVSSYVPPPLPQQPEANANVYNNSADDSISLLGNVGERDISHHNAVDEEYEWETPDKISSATFNNSNTNADSIGDDQQFGNDRGGGRGGAYRGGRVARPRGPSNGFSSRGSRNFRGSYRNGRGYGGSDRDNEHRESEFDQLEVQRVRENELRQRRERHERSEKFVETGDFKSRGGGRGFRGGNGYSGARGNGTARGPRGGGRSMRGSSGTGNGGQANSVNAY